jgi:hypothetical protein
VGAGVPLGVYDGRPSSRLLNGTVEIFLKAAAYSTSSHSVFVDRVESLALIYLHIR